MAPHFIHPKEIECGVTNGYPDPSQLGSDRWAALIAARNLCVDPLAVVDCGTAVTVDALDMEGNFRGGVILPGVTLSRDTLLANTSGIYATREVGNSVFACSTEDAVAGGTFYSVVGGIDRILDEFEQKLVRTSAVGYPHTRRLPHWTPLFFLVRRNHTTFDQTRSLPDYCYATGLFHLSSTRSKPSPTLSAYCQYPPTNS